MIGFGNVKKQHKKNQNKIDDFLRKQGINVKSSNQTSYENMSLEELVTVKENLEDLIAEKELGSNVDNVVVSKK